jgi:probable F420-dependent oxidoreductase
MPGQRPFRFGFNAIASDSRAAWRAMARKTEALGYSTLSVADHLWTGLAPLTSLMAAAESTTTLRVGGLVFGNDFRHPVALAKEVATLDVLSEGRVEFGFGTGWELGDYTGLGLTMDPVGQRVSRFEEAIRLVKLIFGEAPVTFAGRHYQLAAYNGLPKPVQKPHPPLLIGGGGRRMLSLAAREADIVSVNPLTTADGRLDLTSTTEAYADQRLAWIKEAAGARLDALEINILVTGLGIGRDRRAIIEKQASKWGLTPDDATLDVWLTSPHMLFGTESEIVDTLQMRRERFGISYITIFGEEHLESFAPIVARLAGT